MSYNTFTPIVTNGLVLCLDAANTKSYPSTGTSWLDLSRVGSNGSLINGPTFTNENGGGIIFDGSDSYVNIGTNNLYYFNQTKPFTLSCWFKPTNISNVYGYLINRYNGSVLGNYYFAIGQNGLLSFLREVPPYGPVGITQILDNIYYHAIAVYNGVNMRIYLNGELDSSIVNVGNISANQSNLNLIIGATQQSGNIVNSFPGVIYSVNIYNRALSDSEVLQNYNATKYRFQ